MTLIDGISAYDLISREAMLQGLARLEEGRSALPFVRLFYGVLSEYLWEDESGTTYGIQGEGGEQRDAMMPLLGSTRPSVPLRNSCVMRAPPGFLGW